MKKQIENWLQKLSQDNIDDNGIVALYFGMNMMQMMTIGHVLSILSPKEIIYP